MAYFREMSNLVPSSFQLPSSVLLGGGNWSSIQLKKKKKWTKHIKIGSLDASVVSASHAVEIESWVILRELRQQSETIKKKEK